MARTTTKKTRRPVSKARREAAPARDAEILAKAAEALADPKIGERIAALVTTPRKPRGLRCLPRSAALRAGACELSSQGGRLIESVADIGFVIVPC